MQIENLDEIQINQESKNARISDSTMCTEWDSRSEQAIQNSFQHLDFKKNTMTFLIRNNFDQNTITRQNIIKLVDWLFSCFWRFDMEDDAIVLALSLLRAYIRNKPVQKETLQGLGVACLFISSKYTMVKKITMEDAVLLCNGVFSSDEITDFQFEILELVGFQLEFPSPYKYLEVIQSEKDLSADEVQKFLFWIQVWMLQGLLDDLDQKELLLELYNFIQNPLIQSPEVVKLISFISKGEYKYVIKRCLSFFDIDSYLSTLKLV